MRLNRNKTYTVGELNKAVSKHKRVVSRRKIIERVNLNT